MQVYAGTSLYDSHVLQVWNPSGTFLSKVLSSAPQTPKVHIFTILFRVVTSHSKEKKLLHCFAQIKKKKKLLVSLLETCHLSVNEHLHFTSSHEWKTVAVIIWNKGWNEKNVEADLVCELSEVNIHAARLNGPPTLIMATHLKVHIFILQSENSKRCRQSTNPLISVSFLFSPSPFTLADTAFWEEENWLTLPEICSKQHFTLW